MQLYWSESESERDIAWNGYIVFQVVCLFWVVTTIKEDFQFRLRSNIIAPYNASNVYKGQLVILIYSRDGDAI